jgi:hypothetical protein
MRRATEDYIMKILLSFLILYGTLFPVNRAVIDVRAALATSPPHPAQVSFSAPPQAAFDSGPSTADLSLRLVEAKGKVATLRLQNISGRDIEVPISLDGKKVYEVCGSSAFLKSVILMKDSSASADNFSAETDLYGCGGWKGSTSVLKSSDSILITGVTLINHASDKIPADMFSYALSEDRYSRSGDELKMNSRGLFYIRSSNTE